MEKSSPHTGVYISVNDPDISFPGPRASVGFSHIKRAFFSDLMGQVDPNEFTPQDKIISRITSTERGSPRISLSSDESDSVEDVEISERQCRVVAREVLSPSMEVGAVTVVPTTRRGTVKQYSAVAVSALGAALFVGFVRRGIGTAVRTVGSGLVVVQLLDSLGYAEVHWKLLIKDLWKNSGHKPANKTLRSILDIFTGSIERKVAFVCGIITGFFLS